MSVTQLYFQNTREQFPNLNIYSTNLDLAFLPGFFSLLEFVPACKRVESHVVSFHVLFCGRLVRVSPLGTFPSRGRTGYVTVRSMRM